MDDLSPIVLVLIFAAALAGIIDAVVGGGGLVQIPALFTAFPTHDPATLFGTNKCAAIFGTGNAAWRFSRRVALPWRTILPAALSAFLLSYAGAAVVDYLPRNAVRPLILGLLIFAAVYTWRRRDFGQQHQPAHSGHREWIYATLLGGAIGFYDGFFGPGTGSFLIFLFVRFFGFDFLHASASAKWVNVATNLAALAYFVPAGQIMVVLGLLMAAANIVGSMIGIRLALHYGSGFIRRIFLLLVGVLILRFAWDTWQLGM